MTTIYRDSAVKAGKFVEELKAQADGAHVALDSVERVADKAPVSMQVALEAAGSEAGRLANALLDSANAYELAHGMKAPADIIEHAMHLAFATTDKARSQFALDAATSTASDPYSLQANRAIVSIMSTLGAAVPFANYIPADIGSNEAKLAIVSHVAANTYGEYAAQGLMDGALSGMNYMTSERTHLCTVATTNMTGQITSKQETFEVCAPTGADSLAVKLVRGRSEVYVNGLFAAREIDSRGTGLSPVSGKVTIAGVDYVIGGTVNTDTGEIALTSTPALPANTKVHVVAHIDYERDASGVPSIITRVDDYTLFAKPWRVTTFQSIDSRTQMSNELGLDPYAEAVYSINVQFANERHVAALRKVERMAMNNAITYDFDYATHKAAKTRAEIWQDFAGTLGLVSQQMAIDTMSYGVSHLYVGNNVAAQLQSLPSSLFTPSGLQKTAGIYRIGKLFGVYEVYFTPTIVEGTTTSRVICVGRAPDPARCPIIMGDAVPPTMIPLAVNADLKTGAGFYARTFTDTNPHPQSARGCALIDIINL